MFLLQSIRRHFYARGVVEIKTLRRGIVGDKLRLPPM